MGFGDYLEINWIVKRHSIKRFKGALSYLGRKITAATYNFDTKLLILRRYIEYLRAFKFNLNVLKCCNLERTSKFSLLFTFFNIFN